MRFPRFPAQSAEYKHSRSVFEEKARQWTQRHACGALGALPSGAAGGSGAPQDAPAASADGCAAPAPHKRPAEEDAPPADDGGAGPGAEKPPDEAAVAPQRKRLQLSRPAAAP